MSEGTWEDSHYRAWILAIRLFLNLKYNTSFHSGISFFVTFHYKIINMFIPQNLEKAEKEEKILLLSTTRLPLLTI